ncbi:ABC transporter permease [Inquilinus limosus]|uniref:Peptide ABC transporter permease n=1 Tax=Inquilinus limosus MP06 TaxID=1398085 RepID=A0A0A0D9J9_9PROT|nr:ABC transporter permease [Inquilinus limosus]KGM35361.1 peptide ABC transporter permease [Inquilinus limosus MP06]
MRMILAALSNRKAAIGLFIVAALVVMALIAPLLTDYNPSRRVGRPHEEPSATHVLGTTRNGYDVFAQLVYGARTSLAVGFGAGLLITVIGTAVGIAAGYLGGKVDEALNFATNVVLVIPNLPLLLVLAAFIGQASPLVIALIIGATSWAWGARVTRAQTFALREKEFVRSAEMIGEPRWRIMLFELLPNLVSIVGINFIGSVIYSVITEATLEFLGLGDPQTISWGIMLFNAQNASAMAVGAWWELLAPCAVLALLGAGLSLLNFAIDEVANPQLRIGRSMARWKRLARLREARP